jgi:hypothetical protein
MYVCSQDLRQTQDVAEDAELLHTQDILPDNFHQLAPEDQTVEVACLFARRNPLDPGETATMTAILLAWENGDISGFDAMDMLEVNECCPYDEILGLYLGFLRARAALTNERAA